MNYQETTRAQTLAQRMAAPLTSDELRVARTMGINEDVFLAERNRKLAAELPGVAAHGLDASELAVCAALNLEPASYLAEKARGA